jgi:chloramphenicol 3-O phosphotransferase
MRVSWCKELAPYSKTLFFSIIFNLSKSKIIFLNGCASAGKSTLAKAIQELSKEKFLYVGIDTLFSALPRKIVGSDQKAKEGFRYLIDLKTGDLIEMKVSPYAGLVFSCLPKVVKLLANNGLNVIFDECNFVKKNETEFLINNYRVLFSEHKLLMVGVKCNLAIMEQREKSRGDRIVGTAKIFYQNEKNFHFPYDLIVDTSQTSSFANAQKILEFLKENESRVSA